MACLKVSAHCVTTSIDVTAAAQKGIEVGAYSVIPPISVSAASATEPLIVTCSVICSGHFLI